MTQKYDKQKIESLKKTNAVDYINDINAKKEKDGCEWKLAIWPWHHEISAYEYEHDSLVQAYSDLFKEINYIRPRWINFKSMTLNQLQEEYQKLLKTTNY